MRTERLASRSSQRPEFNVMLWCLVEFTLSIRTKFEKNLVNKCFSVPIEREEYSFGKQHKLKYSISCIKGT